MFLRDCISIMSEQPSPTASLPPDLFLSYCWGGPEAEAALACHRALVDSGYRVWLDTEHMAAGASEEGIEAAMAEGILSSSGVVLCVSAKYACRPNCKAEALFARKKRKPLFFVNVGEPPSATNICGYDPGYYDHDVPSERDKHAWLDFVVGASLWADCRSPSRAAGGGGIATLLDLLAAHSTVKRTGTALPPPPPPPPTTAAVGLAGLPPSLAAAVIGWDRVTMPPQGQQKLLGEGAFAKVTVGRWNGTLVAVKELLPRLLAPHVASISATEDLLRARQGGLQGLVNMFLREAEVQQQLHHPHVVQFFRIVLCVLCVCVCVRLYARLLPPVSSLGPSSHNTQQTTTIN